MTLSSPTSPPSSPPLSDEPARADAGPSRPAAPVAASVSRLPVALERLERQARAEVRALAAATVPVVASPDDMLMTALAWDLGLGGGDIPDPA
ncbi:hypothetical protein HF319_00335 [Xanthomonas sp. Kuri4-1]